MCAFLPILFLCGFNFRIPATGIWNTDHRQDIYELTDTAVLDLTDSTLAMLPQSYLVDYGTKQLVEPQRLRSDLNLCPGERYGEQPSFAKCSAILIGDDLILTAGHCLTKKECKDNEFAFVFGYQMKTPQTQITDFPSSEVYSCKEIVARKNTNTVDFAIVKLDRPVANHRIAKLASQNAKQGQSVFALGHPSGLPLKFSGTAPIERQTKNYFAAHLDAFAGNSGSGVFSADTHELIGVFVRGDEDYDFDYAHQCEKVHPCTKDTCSGEEITNIEAVSEALLEIL